MNLKRIQFFLFLFALNLFIGCSDSDEPSLAPVASVVIINEGNFSAANGSFDLYNKTSAEYSSNAFQSANDFPVGSTIQNAIISGDFILATTNAVDKLEIINKETFESITSVTTGLHTPFGVAANNEYAFLTNWGTFNSETFLYDNPEIITINLATFQISSTLALNIQPQHVVYVKDRLYVSDIGNYLSAGTTVSVYQINEGTLQPESTIDVQPGPDKMVIDANDNLWVLCSSGALVHIDTDKNEVVNTIQSVPVLGFNEKLTIDPAGTYLFWIASSGYPDYNSAIYRLEIANPSLSEPIIEGTNFHGLGVDEDNIFVGDHAAYQSSGKVLRFSDYDSAPKLIETLPSGLAPNGFIFR
ncbi:MAG: hypothetical protein RIA69_15930 [Cyclobacteriaceae bacterium]